MLTKPCLTIADVDRVVEAARLCANNLGLGVTICMVDDSGQLLRLDRLDGAPLISLRVAEGKARTALELKMSTDVLEQAVEAMPSMTAIKNLYPFRGGIPAFAIGTCVGAIGVSGALPEQDLQIAQAGIAAFAEPVPNSGCKNCNPTAGCSNQGPGEGGQPFTARTE